MLITRKKITTQTTASSAQCRRNYR